MWLTVTVETNFPPAHTMLFIPSYPSAQPPYVGWQNIDAFIQSLIKTHNWHQHVMDDTSSWGRFRQVHMKKRGEMCLSLTAVGNSKTVRHFQIVNVRRQSEFRGAKLNHSYPKCAVLLIRAPWKKSPWNRHKIPVTLSQFPTARHIFQTICSFAFYAQIRSFLAYSGFFFNVWTNGYLPIWTLGEPPSAHPHKTSRTETDKFTIFSMSTVQLSTSTRGVWYSSLSPEMLDPTHIGDLQPWGEKNRNDL